LSEGLLWREEFLNPFVIKIFFDGLNSFGKVIACPDLACRKAGSIWKPLRDFAFVIINYLLN
jgi:hypothetical protein